MKRMISWMLVLCMALSLVPAGLAEEFFAEESFFDAAGAADENLFFEEGFFGDESFFAVDGEEVAADAAAAVENEDEDQDEDAVIESRSIVSLVTDANTDNPEWSETTKPEDWTKVYWQTKPVLEEPKVDLTGKKSDVITLSWSVEVKGTIITNEKKGTNGPATKYPTDVKFYLYEINNDTGVAYQVGKPIKPKYDKKLGKFSNKVTLKKQDGNMTYFVRAEKLELGDKKLKLYKESYGVSSNQVNVDAVLATWNKKVTKITLAQQGDAVAISWVDAYSKLDGFKIGFAINGTALTAEPVQVAIDDDDLEVNGNTYSYLYKIPAEKEYNDNDKFTVTITPYKKLKETDTDVTNGVAATSKALKLRTGWATLADFTVEEEVEKTTTTEAVLKLHWTVPVKEEDLKTTPITYTLGGLMSSAVITLSAGEDGVKAEATTDKKSIIIDKPEAEGDNPVEVTIYAKAKFAPTAKVTVQPKQGKTKGVKTTATVALSNLAPVTILSGAQSGENQVTIRFTQSSEPIKGEKFVITGFAQKVTLEYNGTDFGKVDGIEAETIFNPESNQEDIIVVTGTTKAVKKETALKFSVTPQLGKKKGKASAKYAVTVRPKDIAAALGVTIGSIKDGKTTVSFKVLQTNVKVINVSLVSTDSFKVEKPFMQTKQATTADIKEGGKVEVAFGTTEMPVVDGEYTAFVEVILDDGRIVDKVTSLALGEKPIDSKLDVTADIAALQEDINAKLTTEGYTVDDQPIYIGETLKPEMSKLGELAEDVKWAYIVNKGEAKVYDETAGIALAEGANEIRFAPVLTDTEGKITAQGKWSEDTVSVTAYKPLAINEESSIIPGEFVLGVDEKYTVEIKVTGGSGSSMTYLKFNDGTAVSDASGKVSVTAGLPTEAGTTTAVVWVIDNNIKKNGEAYQTDNMTKNVTVGNTKSVDMLTYEFRAVTEGATGFEVAVIAYNKTKNATPNKVIVPCTVYGKPVVEIGNSVFTEAEGEANKLIEEVQLPDTVRVIGESAFANCSKLATMSATPTTVVVE